MYTLFLLNSIWVKQFNLATGNTIQNIQNNFREERKIFFIILQNMLSENAQKNLVALVIENTTIKNSKGKAYLYHFLVKYKFTISNENYVIVNKQVVINDQAVCQQNLY